MARVRRGRVPAVVTTLLTLAACGGAPVTTGAISRETAAGVDPAPSGTSAPATPTPGASPGPTALGKGEGSVSVLAIRGYVEYGGSDPKVNWTTAFERQTGCRVRLTHTTRGEQMERLLARGSYDVISASPEVAGRLIAERKAAPITTSLISGYDGIPRWLRELPAMSSAGTESAGTESAGTESAGTESGGTVYGVPYLWGFHEVLYDQARYGRGKAPKDAAALFIEPGPIMLRDDPLTIADAALALRGRLRPDDPFRLTPAQLDAAVALLAGRKDDARAYWRDSLDVVAGFAPGRLRLAQALPYHRDVLARAGKPVKAAKSARTTGWADSWVISADSASPNCAYRWIEYTISRGVQRQAAAWTGLAPANPDACTGRARRMCDDYRLSDSATIDRIAFAVRPAKDCGDGDGGCTDYTEWDKRWRELVK